MLRASSRLEGIEAELRVALGEGTGNVPHGAELAAFVAAVVSRDRAASGAARRRLSEVAGVAAVIDAAAVLANFEMMTRLADSTGARLNEQRRAETVEMRRALGLDALPSAR